MIYKDSINERLVLWESEVWEKSPYCLKTMFLQRKIGRDLHFTPPTVHDTIKQLMQSRGWLCVKDKGTSLSWTPGTSGLLRWYILKNLYINRWYNYMGKGLLLETFVKHYNTELHSQMPLKTWLKSYGNLVHGQFQLLGWTTGPSLHGGVYCGLITH